MRHFAGLVGVAALPEAVLVNQSSYPVAASAAAAMAFAVVVVKHPSLALLPSVAAAAVVAAHASALELWPQHWPD